MKKVIIFIIIILALFIFFSQRSEDITNENSNEEQVTGVKENGGYETISLSDYLGTEIFTFNIIKKEAWDVETLASGEFLNFYIPNEEDKDTLENSQIFVFSFIANDFQAPSGVSVLSRTEESFAERPAVTYILSQDGEVFGSEPDWRSENHKEVSIRARDEHPSRFYVFAKSPNLSDADFKHFLNSLEF